ncbi:hypothetical protein [Litorimonas haliclonae]|uniref:hypothetical protein n=1 Tax=Litorimonas haliclonae TaxID=2081977 RepID=UPI0039EE309D
MGQTASSETPRPQTNANIKPADISNAEFERAFRTLKSQDQLQFELAEAPPPPKLDWLERFLEPIFKFLGNLLPLFTILFWAFIALGITLLLYIIGKALWDFRLHRFNRDKKNAETSSLYRPSEIRARVLLAAVDALAAKGLFAEAVHQLLFRSIQDIAVARPNVIRRSYTSREIAGLSALTPETRTAFSLIAAEVEKSHFGGRALNEEVFLRCRKAYAQFAVSEPSDETLPITEGAPA